MNNFMAALKSEMHEQTPVWFMRQAGRYLQGYSELRKTHSIKEICRKSDLTLKVTQEPLKLLDVDAAIIFSDITLPLEAMGFKVDFREGVGPVISNSLSSNTSLSGIHDFSVSDYEYSTFDAISAFKEKFPEFPLIGFSGGPLTVASYLVTGKADRDLSATKSLLYRSDPSFIGILELTKDMVIKNCREQVKRGADVIQIFDSWAGYLSPLEFRKYANLFLRDIRAELSNVTKTIYFSTQTGGMKEELEQLGFDFLSFDWRVNLPLLSRSIDQEVGLQGNLDPLIAASASDTALKEAGRLVDSMKEKPNYIFNLGHGVLPDTKPETLREIVRTVHQYRLRS